ncbi:hypothetical protein [Paraburkholderia bannensis]|uniref:hypothetical protein n=1 Tax=Paraburkholderia bannensis TaxID=765414 RepID=UPI002AB6A2BA|nr:hypothetical protein [Paraburkholderia bannensis]
MKKSSIAVLISLSALASIASAQDADNGIQMSNDPARAAQVETHARNMQAQPSTTQFDEASDSARAPASHSNSGHRAHSTKHSKATTKHHKKHASKHHAAQ